MLKKKIVVISICADFQKFDYKDIQVEYYQINISKNKIYKFIQIIYSIILSLFKATKYNTQYIFIGNSVCRIAFLFFFLFKKNYFIYI
mgnify:CR=1 FL=1